ncbi:MAG: AlbA family DNA-binding domain-containing protein [Pseudonocardiaceae bacterium]
MYLRALATSGSVDLIEYGYYTSKIKTRPMAVPDRKHRPKLVHPGWPVKVKTGLWSMTPMPSSWSRSQTVVMLAVARGSGSPVSDRRRRWFGVAAEVGVYSEARTLLGLPSKIPSMDVDQLLRQPEGKRVEFKRDLSAPGPVLRTLIAFANTAGGVLLIGVEDRTRDVRGLADPYAVEERLANLLADRITPRVVPEIEVLPWRSTYLVAVRMHLSPTRPHYLASAGPVEGVYVRVGSTNRRADPALIAEMGRSARFESFDESPMVDQDSEVLDFRAASELFGPVRVLRQRDLVSLGCLVEHQGRQVPSVGGMLLFGRDRRRAFPDIWMQVGSFAGADRSQILDQRDVDGPLPKWVEEAIAFVERNSARAVHIDGPRRRDVPSLPHYC